MKNTINYILIIGMFLAISQLHTQTTSYGEIAVRLSPMNKVSAKSFQQGEIKVIKNSDNEFKSVAIVDDMSISNNTLVGWELIAESMNKGKLRNGNSELTYSIDVCKKKVKLITKTKILSTEGLRKRSSTNFDIKMNISNGGISEGKSITTGIYKDTINLTLCSND